jgi:hypothetical protein
VRKNVRIDIARINVNFDMKFYIQCQNINLFAMSIWEFPHNFEVIFGHNFNQFVALVKHNDTNLTSLIANNFKIKINFN